MRHAYKGRSVAGRSNQGVDLPAMPMSARDDFGNPLDPREDEVYKMLENRDAVGACKIASGMLMDFTNAMMREENQNPGNLKWPVAMSGRNFWFMCSLIGICAASESFDLGSDLAAMAVGVLVHVASGMRDLHAMLDSDEIENDACHFFYMNTVNPRILEFRVYCNRVAKLKS